MCSSLNDRIYSSKALNMRSMDQTIRFQSWLHNRITEGRLFKLQSSRHCKNQIDQNICRVRPGIVFGWSFLGDSKCSRAATSDRCSHSAPASPGGACSTEDALIPCEPTDWIRTAFAQYPPRDPPAESKVCEVDCFTNHLANITWLMRAPAGPPSLVLPQ